MEFEGVSPEVEWEARRVAAAFGVEEWDLTTGYIGLSKGLPMFSCLTHQASFVEWTLDKACSRCGLNSLWINDDLCIFWRGDDKGTWSYYKSSLGIDNRLIARALYRLGLESEPVFTELPYSLSMHEKLELRLSMPREFWPKKWIDLNDESE